MFPPVLRVDRDEQVAQESRVRLTLFGRVPAPELDAAHTLGERDFLPAPERPDRREVAAARSTKFERPQVPPTGGAGHMFRIRCKTPNSARTW